MAIKSSFTILFESPFWIGLYERIDEEKYEVCKITFGAEPKIYEVYDFLLLHWNTLRFSPIIAMDCVEERRINPKRRQRKINEQLKISGVGTKAQQALKLQQEENKAGRKTKSKAQKEMEAKRKFVLRQEKRKEKHKGH